MIKLMKIQTSWYVFQGEKMLAQEFDSHVEALFWASRVFPDNKIYTDNTPNVRLLESLRII